MGQRLQVGPHLAIDLGSVFQFEHRERWQRTQPDIVEANGIQLIVDAEFAVQRDPHPLIPGHEVFARVLDQHHGLARVLDPHQLVFGKLPACSGGTGW